MKNKPLLKKILLCIAVLALLTAFAAVYTWYDQVSAFFDYLVFPSDFKDDKPFSMENFNKLTDDEQTVYICIFNAIRSHPPYIKIPSISYESITKAYFAVKNDNPNLLCFSDSCTAITVMSATLLELHYDDDPDECERKMKSLNDEADRIISDMPSYDSDFEKELYIHDYIINKCVYRDCDASSNAYGCLIEGEAVCSGYSRAAMLLLKKAGIDSVLVSGTGTPDSSSDISHMWNIVWLDGETYHLDVTWDDPDTDSGASHLYFNLTDDMISQDHKDFSSSYACTAVEYNYFIHNGLYFSEYSSATIEAVSNKLADNILSGKNYIEFEFSTDEAYLSAVSGVTDNSVSSSDMYDVIRNIDEQTGGKANTTYLSFSVDKDKRYIKIIFDYK